MKPKNESNDANKMPQKDKNAQQGEKGEPLNLSRDDHSQLQALYLELAETDKIMIQTLREMGLQKWDDDSQAAILEAIEMIEDPENRNALLQWIEYRTEAGIPILPEWTGKELGAWMGSSSQRVHQIQQEAFKTVRKRWNRGGDHSDPASTTDANPSLDTIKSFTVNDEETKQ